MTKTALRKASLAASELQFQLEDLLNDAQEKYDSRSERWQDSDAGQAAQETLDELQEKLVAVTETADWIEGRLDG